MTDKIQLEYTKYDYSLFDYGCGQDFE